MPINIPVYSEKIISILAGTGKGTGKYRIYLKDINWNLFPTWAAGTQEKAKGYVITFLDVKKNIQNKTAELVLQYEPDMQATQESNIGWAAVALGVVILGIVVAGAFTVDKVEKIIETPAGQVAVIGGSLLIIAVVILGLFAVYRYMRKK